MLLPNHPVFWLLVAAVVAPLLAEIPLGFRVPVVVLEVVLGIVIGPHVLGLVHFDDFLTTMFTFGMAASLFMAGMELEWGRIRGRPIVLASAGWIVSLVLAVAIVGAMHRWVFPHLPMIVALMLATTSLGVLLPVFRDGGQLESNFGGLFLAAGSIGEVGPIVAMSLLLSREYSTWHELGLLAVFLVVVVVAAAIGMGARSPRLLALLSRTMHSSTQLPVRIALLLMAGMLVMAKEFGFESIFGAFAAGLIVGLATRGADGKPMRDKIDAVLFGWFFPFFFVGTGINFDLTALTQSFRTMVVVPIFLLLFLVVRGLPVVLLYRRDLPYTDRLPFALSSAVASLSIVVVITEISVRRGSMGTEVAAALVGAALLSVMLFPTIAGILLTQQSPTVDLPMRSAP